MADSRVVYKGVYVMKLIMAYVVVAIHTTDWSLMGLTETAVPYFFIASGFFLFRKLGGSREEDLRVIKQWILKILKLYLIWTAIYLPFTVVGFIRDGLSFQTATAVFLRNLIFVGENYLSWPLWYLLAMVWGGIQIYLLRWLRMPVWSMFLTGVALYLAAHFLDLEHMSLYAKVFRTTSNGFFLGLMFLTAGGMLWQWTGRELRVELPLLWDLLLIGISWVGLQFSGHCVLPLAAGVFLLSYHINLPWLAGQTAIRFGTMSKYIYLTHMIFAGLATLLLKIEEGLVLWVLVAFATTLLSLPCADKTKTICR